MGENYCQKSSILLCGATSTCSGNVNLYSGLEARSCGYPNNVFLCRYHFFQSSRKVICCFPFAVPCSPTLVDCPSRFSPVFENLNPHKIGTKICTLDLQEADYNEKITEHSLYEGPISIKRAVNNTVRSPQEAVLQKLREVEEENKKLREKIDELENVSTALQEENLELQIKLQDNIQFETLFKAFHKAYTRHHMSGGKPLFLPEDMREFCVTHAPGLFELLYATIKNDEKQPTSKKRGKTR